MNAQPVEKYRTPEYPTKLEARADKRLIRKSLPLPLRFGTGLAFATMLLLGPGTSFGTEKDAKSKKTVLQEATKETNGETSAPAKNGKAIVAPVFHHGEGVGSTGCVAVNPPTFISEEEAIEIIKAEFAKRGIRFEQVNVLMPNISIPNYYMKYWKQGAKWQKEIVVLPNQENPFSVDLKNEEKRIAVEFVSRSDYFDLGGPDSTMSVQRYDMAAVARTVSKRMKESDEEVYFGVFYDPMSLEIIPMDQKQIKALLQQNESKKDEAKLQKSENDISKKEAKLTQVRRKQITSISVRESKQLLRLQVRDFIDWLKAQGAI